MRRFFTEHPASVGESYTEHFGVAIRIAGQLAAASAACALHAVVPGLCCKTGSTKIRELNEIVTTGARGAALKQAA